MWTNGVKKNSREGDASKKNKLHNSLSVNALPASTSINFQNFSISDAQDENIARDRKSSGNDGDEVVIVDEIIRNDNSAKESNHSNSSDTAATNQNKTDDEDEIIFVSESGGNESENSSSVDTNLTMEVADDVFARGYNFLASSRGSNESQRGYQRSYRNFSYNERYSANRRERYQSHPYKRGEYFRRGESGNRGMRRQVNSWMSRESSFLRSENSTGSFLRGENSTGSFLRGENSTGSFLRSENSTGNMRDRDLNLLRTTSIKSSGSGSGFLLDRSDFDLPDFRNLNGSRTRNADAGNVRDVGSAGGRDYNDASSGNYNILDGRCDAIGRNVNSRYGGDVNSQMVGKDRLFLDDKYGGSRSRRAVESTSTNVSNSVVPRSYSKNQRELPRAFRGNNWNKSVVPRRYFDKHSDKSKVTTDSENASGPSFSFCAGPNIYYPVSDTKRKGLRPVIIDGPNVAYGHGHDTFSFRGLSLCMAFFLSNNHKEVMIVLPQKLRHFYGITPEEEDLMNHLIKEKKLCVVPSKKLEDGSYGEPYDDRFVVQIATSLGGVIISNDRYEDIIDESEAFRDTIRNRCIPFTFVKDIFILPTDPFGKKGPKLDEIMRFPE